MSFYWKLSQLKKCNRTKVASVAYVGITTLILLNKRIEKKLNHPIFDEILLRLEEDKEIVEEYGLPLSFKTGIIASRNNSVNIGTSV